MNVRFPRPVGYSLSIEEQERRGFRFLTSLGASGCHSADRAVLHRLGPPGARPVNPGFLYQLLDLLRERLPVLGLDARPEADVMQQAFVVVEAEELRASMGRKGTLIGRVIGVVGVYAEMASHLH